MSGVYPAGVDVVRGATLSACGRYRYALLRRWDVTRPPATFVMLNPSTADAELDDPTIRRCVGFTRALDCGGLRVVNLYALRATDPRELWRAADPVGPEADAYLTRYATSALVAGAPLIAAWGAHARRDRVEHVLALPGMAVLTALGVTAAGAPRHPLYLPSAARPTPWPATPTSGREARP